MNVKLTLSLNKDIIERAKSYARDKNQSLSALVQNYFAFLGEKKQGQDVELTTTVRELTGILHLDADFDLKEEYGKHILEKYQ